MKKIIAMLLVLAMCLTSVALIASCGDPKDPAQSSSSPTPGNPDDPNPPHTHTFVEGKCECGETDPDYVPPHTHTFVEGKCECGETDPNYVPPHVHVFVNGKCECGESDPGYVPELEDENGVMLYYQNFDAITGTDNASILAQLGWLDNVNDQSSISASKNGTSDSAGAVLVPDWSNVGLTTNMSLLTIDRGRLKIDNKTNNPNGAYATFLLTKGINYTEDFTIQYDITYEDVSDYMWAGVVLNTGSGAIVGSSRANMNGTFSRIYANGRVELMYQNGHAYKTIANEGITGTVIEPGQLCAAIFGDGADTMMSKTVTVRIVYKNVSETTEGALATGIHVYVKKNGTAEFTLASSTTTKIKPTSIAFVLGGSFDNDQGQANSIIGDLAFRQNTTNSEPITVDGKTYDPYYTLENDASGVVYLDNFAVWKGTGNMPADKTPGGSHTHTFVEGKCECGETDPNDVPPHTHTFVEGKCECGETDPNYVPSHTHTFVEGKCECGETDPNYVPTTPTPDVEDPNGVMLYYQNFDAITGTDNASILAQLGWVDNVYDQTAWTGSQNGTAQCGNALLAPNWANTGLATNMSLLSVTDGMLKIDNKTNNPNGAYSTFAVLSGLALTGKDYTIQYDITYEEASDYMWAGFVLNGGTGAIVGASRSNMNGTFARIYQSGRVELMTQSGHVYKTIANEGITGTVVEAGQLCATIFGEGATTMKSKTITVKLVYKTVAEETEGALATGTYVYVKEKGAAEFTLASYTSAKVDATRVAFVVGGSFDNDQGQANSIIGDLAFRQNTTNKDPITIDGTTYEAYYTAENDASGIVYLDNIAVWEGTGNIPANKTPAN